jgi:hypothetical protein
MKIGIIGAGEIGSTTSFPFPLRASRPVHPRSRGLRLGLPGAWVKHSPPKRLRNASAVICPRIRSSEGEGFANEAIALIPLLAGASFCRISFAAPCRLSLRNIRLEDLWSAHDA